VPRSRPSLLAIRGRALHDIATALASSLDVEEFGARATAAIVEATGWHVCLVYLADPALGVLRRVASSGIPPELLDRFEAVPLDDSTLSGRAARTATPQVSGRTTPAPRTPEFLELLGGDQYIITPLRYQGEVLGTLNAFGARKRRPTGEEVAVLQAVADLLALALRNARLHAQGERERARARFLADVGHAFAGMLDVERVLAEVAAQATGVLGEWCVIYLLDRERQCVEMRAVHHADPRRAEIVRTVFRDRPVRVGEGVAGKVVLDRQPRIIERFDEAAIAALAPRDDPAYANELRQVRSWACLPLEARGEAVGALVVATTADHVLSDDDIALAREFADRAALAIDNAQLYADAQRRAREADFLAEIAALVVGARTPRELLATVAKQATTLLGDACGIFLTAAGQRWMPPAWVEHRDREVGRRLRDFLSRNRTRFAASRLGERLRAGDVVLLNGGGLIAEQFGSDVGRELVDEFEIQSMLAVTIGNRRQPLGAMLCVRHGPPAYTAEDARLIRLVADHTGSALVSVMLNAKIDAERSRLAALIDELPEGVIIASAPDGRLVLGNRAATQLLGRGVAGETRSEWVPEFRITTADGMPFETEALPLSRALQGETVRGLELWIERPDGRRVAMLASAAPLRGPDGVVDDAVVVFQDITTIKEAERIKDQWLSIASHELRTPITSLRGFAQLLERQVRRTEDAPGREALIASLATITQQANRLTQLVNDLLDVSRIQLGRLELRRRPVDLCELVRSAVSRAADLDPAAGRRLELRMEADQLKGEWDPDRLDQVLTNLIANAVKYDPSGGPIVLRAWRAETEAVVEVADQGIGVPAPEMETLFRPFARAANATRRGFGGIGLGLYISRDIVERHGGNISATSVEGEGTTITLRLPLS
jgi:PAS domain S-box-containing protein